MAKFTKQAICGSFMKFLMQKPLDQITVKDIVDDCEINRKTFYYYYQDIYALMNDVFEVRLQQFFIDNSADICSLSEVLTEIALHLYVDKKLTLHVFKSLGYEKVHNIIFDSCMTYLPPFIKKQATELTITDSDFELIASYVGIVVSGIFTRWINQGLTDIPGSIINRFFDITKGCTRLLLENADKLNKR